MLSRYIALDIGEVCIGLQIERSMSYFGLTELPIPLQVAIDAYERGKITEADAFNTIRGVLPKPMTDAEIKHGWNLILGDEMPGAAALVREGIRLGYRFVFFTDTSPSHFLRTVSFLSFAHLIDGRITSYEVGEKKPHEDMFEAFELAFGEPILYFDDKPENILTAKTEHGWNAHQFTSHDEALRVLREYHAAHRRVIDMEDDDFEG